MSQPLSKNQQHPLSHSLVPINENLQIESDQQTDNHPPRINRIKINQSKPTGPTPRYFEPGRSRDFRNQRPPPINTSIVTRTRTSLQKQRQPHRPVTRQATVQNKLPFLVTPVKKHQETVSRRLNVSLPAQTEVEPVSHTTLVETFKNIKTNYDLAPRNSRYVSEHIQSKDATAQDKSQIKSEKKHRIKLELVPQNQTRESYISRIQRISPVGEKIRQQFQQLKSNVKRMHSIIKCFSFDIQMEMAFAQIQYVVLTYMEGRIRIPDSEWLRRKRNINVDSSPNQITDCLLSYEPLTKGLDLQKIGDKVTLKKYKNCVYFGELNSAGQKQGRGLLLYFDKDSVFQGYFAQDYKKEGVELRSNGVLYLGTYKLGLLSDDKGILYDLKTNKMTYGCFRQGTWINNGLQFNPSKELVISTFDCNLYRSASKEHDAFIGKLSNGTEKAGVGLQLFENGDVYLGGYQKSEPNGYGEYFWHNGATYKGGFVEGRREGMGQWKIEGGDSYIGMYQKDVKHGHGVYCWANGSRYEGAFASDYRHGFGQMKMANGQIVSGNWQKGMINNNQKNQTQSTTQTSTTNLTSKVQAMRDSYLRHARYKNYKNPAIGKSPASPPHRHSKTLAN